MARSSRQRGSEFSLCHFRAQQTFPERNNPERKNPEIFFRDFQDFFRDFSSAR